MRRYFNTSGPNIPSQHYTIRRKNLIAQGKDFVYRERYFTIWAPRQTGKTTYFRQLAEELQTEGYQVAHINFENFKTASEPLFLQVLKEYLGKLCESNFDNITEIPELFSVITKINDRKLVLIIDEVEGINEKYFGTFLHSIRNAYHSRETHALKSVILVGVANITGVIGDNASPFNIADNLNVPYFTDAEVYELLGQHETETGQLFEQSVKDKIIQIAANQPGLVNGFAQKLITDYPDKNIIEYADYLKVEDWYLTVAIDKNFENIRNKAQEVRPFVERLLFTEEKIPFDIDRPAIKLLHINGVVKKGEDGNVTFWVPFYKKRLYKAFYPYANGEKQDIIRSFAVKKYFDAQMNLLFKPLIQ
ncbi:AAA family ATPase, partial [Rhodoflexus sp.]